jgi:hypothetical protein
MMSRFRVLAGSFGAVLLLVPLAGCPDASTSDGTESSSGASATQSPPADGSSGAPNGTEASGSASDVDCSAGTCSLTLTGEGAEAVVLGTAVVLGRIEDGRASLRLSGMDGSCGSGDSTTVGSFSVQCTTVTGDAVTLTLRRM